MLSLSSKLFSKDWVNLNPGNDPNSIDLYYNERLSLFSLSPIFEKEALPELYELYSKNFHLKLKLPFLQSHPDFLEEYAKLKFIDQQFKKPTDLEDFSESKVFLERMSLILDENYQEEINSSNKSKNRFNFKRTSCYLSRDNQKKFNLNKDSESTIVEPLELELEVANNNFKENTIKLKQSAEKQFIKGRSVDVSLEETLKKFKLNILSNVTIDDFRRYRIEDHELLKGFSFNDLKKNEVALFYEIFQKVHKIKPVFTYCSLISENKSAGNLILDSKPMMQVIESCKRDAKKNLCSMGLEIFCPLICTSAQHNGKRKSHQVKGLMDPLIKPKRKKIKTDESSKDDKSKQEKPINNAHNSLVIAEEKPVKNSLENFMRPFENINKILGNIKDSEPNFEQKDPLETLSTEQRFAEEEALYPFLLDFFPEDMNPSPFQEQLKLKEKEPGEINFENNPKPVIFTNNYNNNQKIVNTNNGNNMLGSFFQNINSQSDFINNNNNNHNFTNINNNFTTTNNNITSFQNPINYKKPSNFVNNCSIQKPQSNFRQFPKNHVIPRKQKPINNNFGGFRGPDREKLSNSSMDRDGSHNNFRRNSNNSIHERDKGSFDRDNGSDNNAKKVKDIALDKGNISKESDRLNGGNNNDRFVVHNIKEEEELEEELKRISGKRVIYIDDLLKDMGNAQKNYPINLANDFLDKLLKFHSLKNEEFFRVFTIKDKGVVRVSIKRNEKGEICFSKNENLLIAKYFCLIDFFKLKYGPKSTVNEILNQLIRKNSNNKPQIQLHSNQNPPKMAMTTTSVIINNKPNKEEKINNSVICGLLDDIDSFQYSLNTINNKRKDEGNDIDLEENEIEDEIIKKKKDDNFRKKDHIHKKKQDNEENNVIMHSTSVRDREREKTNRYEENTKEKMKNREESIEKIKDKESSEEIIFIE